MTFPRSAPATRILAGRSILAALAVVAAACSGADAPSGTEPAGGSEGPIQSGDVVNNPDLNSSVNITYTPQSGRTGRGSGVLLGQGWVLTAKHIFLGDKVPDPFQTIVAQGNKNLQAQGNRPTKFSRARFAILHPSLDVALVKLVEPEKLNPITPASLFQGTTQSLVGKDVRCFGYGKNHPSAAASTHGEFLRTGVFRVRRVQGTPINVTTPDGTLPMARGAYFVINPTPKPGFALPQLPIFGDSGGPCFTVEKNELAGVIVASGPDPGTADGVRRAWVASLAALDPADQSARKRTVAGWVQDEIKKRTAADGNNLDGESDLYFQFVPDRRNAIVLYMSSTQVFFPLFLPAQTDESWKLIGTGEFDNDGEADVVWRHDGGANEIWLLGGLNIQQKVSTWSVNDPDWTIAAVGDANGDGISDLIWRNTAVGNYFVWMMNPLVGDAATDSTQTLFFGTPLESNPGFELVAAGDLDHQEEDPTDELVQDNIAADLVWRNPTNGENQIWLMSFVDGAYFRTVTIALPSREPHWRIGALADYNRDGFQDIVWQAGPSAAFPGDLGRIELWLRDEATPTSVENVPVTDGITGQPVIVDPSSFELVGP